MYASALESHERDREEGLVHVNVGESLCQRRAPVADHDSEMAKYEKSSPTAIHTQTSYHHGVNC